MNKSFSNCSNPNSVSILKKKSSSGSKSFRKKISFREDIENENYAEYCYFEKSPKGSGEKGIRTSPMQVTPHDNDHPLFISYYQTDR